MADCIFCKIVRKEVSSEILFEDDKVVVFKDLHPKARVHLLVVAKAHIKSLAEVKDTESPLLSHMLLLMPTIAHEQGLTNGFRTVINTGSGGGQIIDHIHFHLLGGGALPAL